MNERIVLIGAGSAVFTAVLIADLLRLGEPADVALVDPDRPWIVDSGKMAASAGNTPFDRQPVQGRALALFKGGSRIDR